MEMFNCEIAAAIFPEHDMAVAQYAAISTFRSIVPRTKPWLNFTAEEQATDESLHLSTRYPPKSNWSQESGKARGAEVMGGNRNPLIISEEILPVHTITCLYRLLTVL